MIKEERLLLIEEIEARNPNIRSKTAIRTSPKKSMIDPSLTVAALGCSPKEIMLDIRTFGLLFENLVNRDLSVYVNSLGGTRIKEAEEHLLTLKDLILKNEPKIGELEFLMVITGTDMAYTTENGVLVVPIGCLKN